MKPTILIQHQNSTQMLAIYVINDIAFSAALFLSEHTKQDQMVKMYVLVFVLVAKCVKMTKTLFHGE